MKERCREMQRIKKERKVSLLMRGDERSLLMMGAGDVRSLWMLGTMMRRSRGALIK